ncbi:hypothetical protein AB0E08_17945 [Streptomyces sp. NPDC048281]|uniref:hypothetical protein n=1 Tax=Streptomyces sp. NPDC048281 TaxID=3154715 RepID=UPI003427B2B4
MVNKAFSWIQEAVAVTARPSLDLLGLPFPFSQLGLLTARQFADEANKRRPRMRNQTPSINEQILEELHRHGVLVPLFRVSLASGKESQRLNVSDSATATIVHHTVISELYFAASEGRAYDPAAEDFTPWSKDRLRTLWPTYESGFLYSHRQLLGLEMAFSYVSSLTPKRVDESVRWSLGESDVPNEPTSRALDSWRSLALVLCALDTYYWPLITRSVSHDLTVWRQVWADFKPAELMTWLGISTSQLAKQVQDLKMSASFRDDMGKFYDVIRRADASAWETMRGDARCALDFRLAADVLERCSADASPDAKAPGPEVPLSHQGLSEHSHSLDAALTRLHLSPFPSLVIGLEGETEHEVVPRVMELLGIDLNRNRIELVNYGGTTKDLSLLARYASQPVLGKVYGDHVTLDRPVTRFLVLADAEKKYTTRADREKQRKILLESITKHVPAEYQKDLRSNLRRGRFVEIRTWGKLPFEFAHFTDREIARALSSLARAPHPGGYAGLVAQVAAQRALPNPSVDRIDWRGRGPISKPKLADELWPVLERKIRRALDKRQPGPPVMRAVLRAYEMVSMTPRSSVALKHTSPRRK